MQLSRRDFVGVGAVAVALCGIGAAAVATRPADAVPAPLRPPGGQDEGRLLSMCMRCDRCRSACPTSCIGTGVLEDGLLGVRTPVMDYSLGGCTFCNRCIESCPSGALVAFDPHADKIGMAAIHADVCIAFRSPGSCEKCKDSCEFDAVTISQGHPVIVRDRCNGCGRCENACPAIDTEGGEKVHGVDVYALDAVTSLADDKYAVESAGSSAAESASGSGAAGGPTDGEVGGARPAGASSSRGDSAHSASVAGEKSTSSASAASSGPGASSGRITSASQLAAQRAAGSSASAEADRGVVSSSADGGASGADASSSSKGAGR
jgi:ferredoxin-type protein NapG